MEIKEKNEFKVIGMEIVTTVQECQTNNPFPELWKKFMTKIPEIKNRKGEIFYGVSFDTGKECEFRSLAAVEVENTDNVLEGLKAETVPKSRYAVFEHKGKLDNLTQTYERIHEKDMPESGLKQTGIWLEVYDDRFKEGSDDSVMEIWVAIE